MGRIFTSFIALIAIITSTSNLKADGHADMSYFQFSSKFL